MPQPSTSGCFEGHGSSRDDSDWLFLQCFGERTPGEEIQDADIISAVEFDADGSHLATGDRGGRVVLFERVAASSSQDGNDGAAEEGGTPIDVEVDGGEGESGAAASTSGYNNNNSEQNPDVRPRNPNSSSSCPPFEYRYLTEFQSHEPEFDYLKSLEIEEKINKVRWARRNVAGSSNKDALASSSSRAAAADSANGRLLLSTNDKTIKLWRVYDRRVVTLAGFNTARGALGGLGSGGAVGGLMSSGGGGSGGRGDLIGVGRMPPVAAGAGDGTGEGEEEASPSSGAGATTAAAAAEAAANPRPPPGTTPWSIAVSARSSEPRAPRPPPPAPPSSSSSPTCEAEDERIGNKIKAFGISSDSGGRSRAKAAAATAKPSPPPLLSLPRAVAARAVLSARCRRTFAGAHAYHVNSLSMCSDGETFLSADDLRVQLWHLDAPPREGSSSRTDRGGNGSRNGSCEVDDDGFSPKASTSGSSSSSPFFFSVGSSSPSSASPASSNAPSASAPYVLVDMKPACMDDLTEVITAAEFHPSDCALFCHASSKGIARVCDMRSAALCDRPALALEPPGLGEGGGEGGGNNGGGGRSFFSEITASLSDARWCGHEGRGIVTRDYLNLTLWDLAMPSAPVAVYPIHDCLRPRLADLYENDCVFDKFGVAVSGDGKCAASGTYSSLFRVVPGPGDEGAAGAMGNGARLPASSGSSLAATKTTTRQGAPGLLLEASRDPRRKRALAATAAEGANAALGPPPGLGRFGLAPSPASARALTATAAGAIRGGPDDDSAEAVASDLTAKMLHLAWHPGADVIAAAASNSLYLYYRG